MAKETKETKKKDEVRKETKKEDVKKGAKNESGTESLKASRKETDSWKVLVYPQLAEKSMNMVEMENKLVFIVNKRANKEQIKKAIEKEFNVRVIKINVEVTRKGEKKAYIKLHPDDSAADIASRMGML